MNIIKNQNGIWTTDAEVVTVDEALISELRQAARTSPKKRARLCTHRDASSRLHEMIIALDQSTYVQPHRHSKKSESFHIIDGKARIILFHADGTVRGQVVLGDRSTGRAFFYRIATPIFHTLLIESEVLILHETTNGPFVPGETEYAKWAPAENADPALIDQYLRRLRTAPIPPAT